MTEQTSTYLCNSAVKTPVEYKKTVEYNLGKKEEKRQFCIPAKKFQSKHSGIHSSRKTLESNRTGSYSKQTDICRAASLETAGHRFSKDLKKLYNGVFWAQEVAIFFFE